MSIDAAASVIQTVSTIQKQLARGLTISVENNHCYYHLRNMEYWSETDCFNAPTITIGPGKWGVGAFKSKVTCGTKGILCYELLLDEWKLKNRLFLLIGWNVPLVGDNTYFLQVAHVDSPNFPQTKYERKKVCDMLMEKETIAGNTTFIHSSPKVEDYAEESISPVSLSVCATMATSAIANLKVEINPYLEPITNDIKSPLLIPSPGKKKSFTNYMEESFENAEAIINDAFKYIGMEDQ
ncbi:2356_t:CDS:2 [Funneliformis geosporum]|uniref:8081_t:CDS:1 n=1 Tax=Funneliformis geosporum TaxID=1117311 RepID=A0A9W4SXI0_9GLOM|nr:8081_t:CDS:2 [Funneliformis geosporum]CAI2185259.1 2356_t:CDS:2 [Funneliformis geosporum]